MSSGVDGRAGGAGAREREPRLLEQVGPAGVRPERAGSRRVAEVAARDASASADGDWTNVTPLAREPFGLGVRRSAASKRRIECGRSSPAARRRAISAAGSGPVPIMAWIGVS